MVLCVDTIDRLENHRKCINNILKSSNIKLKVCKMVSNFNFKNTHIKKCKRKFPLIPINSPI